MTATESRAESHASDHLLPADPAAWQQVGPITPHPTREPGVYGVSVAVSCLPPPGLAESATAAANQVLDVTAAVQADPRVVEALARRDRLAQALSRDRESAKLARAEADRHAADARKALAAGDDPDPAEAARDEAAGRADKLAARVGELAELLTGAARDLDVATESARRDARLAVKAEHTRRLADVSALLSGVLSGHLAELWACQTVLNSLTTVH